MKKSKLLLMLACTTLIVSSSRVQNALANNGIPMWCVTMSSSFRLDGGREVDDIDWCFFTYEEALRAYRLDEDGPYALFSKSVPFRRNVIDNGIRIVPHSR